MSMDTTILSFLAAPFVASLVIAGIHAYLGVVAGPVFCTKIASRLTRTYTDRHGLKELVRELLGLEL